MSLSPGQVVGRYRVIARIGGGGLATVYRVEHVDLGTPLALKVLHAVTPGVVERLAREGRAQGRLQHPNVVRVVDRVEGPDGPALVMDLANGPPLERLLADRRPTLAQAVTLVRDIARGLAAAHEIGLVHRDLKPSNVLLHLEVDRVTPKVADFGLALELDQTSRQTRSGMRLGTPSYMAPEQIRDPRMATAASDVFALAALAYELLTGELAFGAPDRVAVWSRIARGSYAPLPPEVPQVLADAIAQGLSVDPNDRPRDAAAFLALWSAYPLDRDAAAADHADLATWVRGWVERAAALDLAVTLDPPPSSADEPPPRRGWLGWVAGALTLAALGLVGFSATVGAGVVGWRWLPREDGPVLPPLVPRAESDPAESPVEVRAPPRPRAKRTAPPAAVEEPPVAVAEPVVAEPVLADPVCADLDSLEPAASIGALSTAEIACLDERLAGAEQVDRDFASRLLVRDAQERSRTGSCADFDRRLGWHLDQVSRGDPALVYTWASHLAAVHRPARDEDVILWAGRALEDRDRLGEGPDYTTKVARLLEVRAEAATEVWVEAQRVYLAGGRTPALEAVEARQRSRAKTAAREWLDFVIAAGRDATTARVVCATAWGTAC